MLMLGRTLAAASRGNGRAVRIECAASRRLLIEPSLNVAAGAGGQSLVALDERGLRRPDDAFIAQAKRCTGSWCPEQVLPEASDAP
jgi:hypothetical protein